MQIFVAHAFSTPPLWNYRKPFNLVANKYNMEFKFADEIHKGEHLLDQIEELIVKSNYCLFDVSSPNRNVFLELGFARGRGKDYSLLFRPAQGLLYHLGFTERFAELPADIRGLRHITYTRVFPTLAESRGFPNQWSSDSSCMLEAEASMHGSTLFARST